MIVSHIILVLSQDGIDVKDKEGLKEMDQMRT